MNGKPEIANTKSVFVIIDFIALISPSKLMICYRSKIADRDYLINVQLIFICS